MAVDFSWFFGVVMRVLSSQPDFSISQMFTTYYEWYGIFAGILMLCYNCLLYTSGFSVQYTCGPNGPLGSSGPPTAYGVYAVSYTHLDVYKRQIDIIANRVENKVTGVSKARMREVTQ